jgi:hypothetical protein
MAYERSWSFSFDNFYTATSQLDYCRWQFWALKALLTGQLGGLTQGLWTMYASCDSVTAGTMNDGVDRWGSTYTPANIVRGTAAAVRSWYVLKSPTMNGVTVYVTFSFDGTDDRSATLMHSIVAPTGGTTTARPTASGERPFSDSLGLALYWNGAGFGLTSVNLSLSTTGDFIFFAFRSGATSGPYANTAVMVMAPVDCHASDTRPIFTFKYGGAEGGLLDTAFNHQMMSSPLAANGCATQNSAGTDSHAGLPVIGGQVVPGTPDVLTGKLITLPAIVQVHTSVGGTWHLRGRLPDIFLQPDSGSSASYVKPGTAIMDATGNVTHVCVGGVIFFPANSIPALFV